MIINLIRVVGMLVFVALLFSGRNEIAFGMLIILVILALISKPRTRKRF